MHTATDADQIEEAVAALGPLHADLAQRLRTAGIPDDLVLETADDGGLTGTLGGVRLASRREPVAEGARVAAGVDVIEHAAVVVFGFGLGHHVRALAENMKGLGLIIVVEPNEGLLRAALAHGDHARWLRAHPVVFITEPDDPGVLNRRLQGADALVCQGLCFLDHPASMRRLADIVRPFRQHMADHVLSARTTLVTSLLRAVETVRNITLNLPWHAGGPGINDLAGAAEGAPAVLVSAGPSLRRNIRRLGEPGVRDRCVIIAAQTTLKPLLHEGIRPHFVTALDYHEISRRFYDGLTEDDLRGITLIADPKANPAILNAFRGQVRCFDIPFLTELLGKDHPSFGALPAGATVAHLSLYLARFLGCNPIAMIGQDLGFPDALYYAPGTAIHEVWAPELNPFNTIANMEWQRIARHRQSLQRRQDIHGRMIHTDLQMVTYLQQFERDFVACRDAGVRIIDATEGGVAKRHVETMPLSHFLSEHATRSLPALPEATPPDPALKRRAAARLRAIDDGIAVIRTSSRRTVRLLRDMRQAESGRERSDIYRRIDQERRTVEQQREAFNVLNHMNQLGAFRRARADRRIELLRDTLTPRELENAQIDRDVDNVRWIDDAAEEMSAQLRAGRARLDGRTVSMRPKAGGRTVGTLDLRTQVRAAALVPLDPSVGGLGPRGKSGDPMRHLAGRPLLHHTLEALDRTDGLESTILLVPDHLDTSGLLTGLTLRRPVTFERTGASPFGAEHRAISAARLFASASWRAGVAGMSIWDEALSPAAMLAVMERRNLTAALIAGADWAFLRPRGQGGCSDVLTRHAEHPDLHRLVFTQACPGISGCVINRSLMTQLSERSRLGTLGALLVHQPSVPQVDPVHRDANVSVDHLLRTTLLRAIPDSPLRHEAAERVLRTSGNRDDVAHLLAALEQAETACADGRPPAHLVLEATTRRSSDRSRANECDLSPELVFRLCSWCAQSEEGTVTFGGKGDPLLHPSFGAVIDAAYRAGMRAVHVRTTLCDDESLDRLIAHLPDIVSIQLDADRPDTWRRLHPGTDPAACFARIERLVAAREHLSGPAGFAAIARPWIVPRLERKLENVEDIESFFDRWQHLLGTAVIESAEGGTGPTERIDGLIEAVTPASARRRALESRLFVRADGTVPLSESGPHSGDIVAHAEAEDPSKYWPHLRSIRRTHGGDLRMIHP